jgi:hypothetical protein
MNDTKNYIKMLEGLAQDHQGNLSSSRSLMLLYGVGVFVAWALASIEHSTLQEIPDSAITIFGVLISSKTLKQDK